MNYAIKDFKHSGYQISSNNSISHAATTNCWLHTNKQIATSVSPPTGVKTTTNEIYASQFKYANTMPTVLCTNNGLIHGYSLLPSYTKEASCYASREIYCNPLEFYK